MLVFLVALLSIGCAVPFRQSQKQGSGVLVVALDAPVLTLDPAHVTDMSSARVTTQICETLVEYNSETGAITPLLAQSWAVSGDGRVWTFALRSGVTFHDGTPLNAEAVVQNVLRWMDTANPYHLGEFDFWRLLFGGFIGSGSIVRGVERVDDLRVRLTLEQPQSTLLAALSLFPFAIISPAAMGADIDSMRFHPVCSGAFRVTEWKPGGEVVLAANERYWGGRPKLDGVRFTVLGDASARLTALRTGQVHLVEGSDAATANAARQIAGVKVVLRPSRSNVFLSINNKTEEFADARVRQAIAQAINRQAIVDKVYGGLALVSDQFTPPGVPGRARSLTALTFNRSAAQQLMNESGYGGGMMTQIWYSQQPRPWLPNARTIAELIADDLREIGIVAVTSGADWPTLQRRSLEGSLPLSIQVWTGDSPDADSYLTGLFDSDSAARAIGYTNPVLKTTLADARAQAESAERQSLYEQAAAIIRRDMPRAPLVHPQSPALLAGSVRGFSPSLVGAEAYRALSIEK